MAKISAVQNLTTSNIIGQKQLNKLKEIPLPPLLDLTLTRVYFTNINDGLARIFIVLVQILWIGLVFFMGIELGKIVSSLPQIPPLPAFQNATLQIVTMILTTIFAFLILIMILPVFLAKTIKGITLTCWCYLIVGTIINVVIIVISFFMFHNSAVLYRTAIVVLSFVGLFLWWCFIANWWINTKKSKNKLVKSIIKMYQLNYK